MIKVENLRADGFEAAFRGMRNPLDSWDKSDSQFGIAEYYYTTDIFYEKACNECQTDEEVGQRTEYYCNKAIIYRDSNFDQYALIGPNDMKLAQRLISAGPEHAKFLRQINISFDLTLPLYTWKEFDTYKVGTTANSCSTMHTIHKKEFTLDDFSHDHMYTRMGETYEAMDWLVDTIDLLNRYRQLYLDTKDKTYWYSMIQMLPTSYLQKRTVTMNYAVLRNIIKQRKGHKLEEWHSFIDAVKELPYAEELIFYKLEE